MSFAATPSPRDLAIAEWQETAAKLAVLKELEIAQRNAIFGSAFPKPKEGVNNLELGRGYILKATHSFNYNLSNSDRDGNLTDKALDGIEKLGPEGRFIAERLVTWKPSLSITEYRRLLETNGHFETKAKALISSALTITPAAPKLEVVAPKVAQ